MHTTRSRAPAPKFAKPGANPTLQSIEYVRAALMAAETPISRNGLLDQLKRWGHSMTRQSLNAALAFLAADGSIVEGSKGLVWVRPAAPAMREVIQRGRKL
jgi:hypothetical protein